MRLSTSSQLKSLDSPPRTSRPQYQELFETLGIIKSQSTRALPSSLRELKFEKKILPDLALPGGRKDAQSLLKWLDSMLSQVTSNSTDIESILESALSIYETCFNEVVRQVSIHCKERGELISRVWKAYISLLERALRISQTSQQNQNILFKQEKENIRAAISGEIVKLKEEVSEKNATIANLSKKLQFKEEEMMRLEQNKQRLANRLDIIISHYEIVKSEVVELKEENRILKAKLLNTETEFIVNNHGVIEAQHKRQKIKRKSKVDLEQIVCKDPILSYGGSINYAANDQIIEDIEKHESEVNEIFMRIDFQDASTGCLTILTEEQEVQSDISITGGDCEGEPRYMGNTVSMVIELIDLNFQAMITNKETNSRELKRQSTRKKEDLDPFIRDSNNYEKINVFIEKMKENLGAILNQNINYSPYFPSFTKQKSLDETRRLKTIRKKMWNSVQESKQKKPADIGNLIVQKIKNTPQHKLKTVVVKKMLLKTISAVYDSRIQKLAIDPESRKQELSQLFLDYLSNKYGPGKLAESKMTQILSSCVKYIYIKRVRLFSRFLKLADDLDLEDLDLYLDLYLYIKSSSCKDYSSTDYSDQLLISYEKAVDLFKSPLLHVLTDQEKKSTKTWVESNKTFDTQYKGYVIDLDSYLEIIIDRSRSKKNAKTYFIRCIYEAADLNEDGYLQQVEFDLLAKHMAAFPLAEGYTREVFKEFAEEFRDENDSAVEALSFKNFSLLNSAYGVFSVESMQSFSKISNDRGAVWHISQVAPHIDQILQEIEWRLSKKRNWNEYRDEYRMVLSIIKNKVALQKNPESVWIALRLLQEESKYICIDKALNGLLPQVKHLVITSSNIL